MSNVLLATVDFPPQRGGVARYLEAITQTLQDKIDVLYWEGQPPRHLSLLWELYKASKHSSAIWLSHIVPVGTAALLIRLMTKKPYVVFLHGMDFDLAKRHPARKLLAFFILKSAQHLVCNSNALALEVQQFVGVKPMVVYPPVRDALITSSEDLFSRKDHFHQGSVHLLTVARLVERKGHEKVLEAIKDMPNVTYDIVGDGPERQHLEQKIIDLGLHERVRVYPHVKDEALPSVYATADLFVMPTTKTKTDREGFGIVYLEAMLFGVPVIATNHPGVDEAVKHNVTGLLFEDTPEALHAAIDQLVHDPGRREQLGKEGREVVLGSFTRELQMRKLLDIL